MRFLKLTVRLIAGAALLMGWVASPISDAEATIQASTAITTQSPLNAMLVAAPKPTISGDLTTAAGCPSNGAACLYDRRSYGGFLASYNPPGSCRTGYITLANDVRNRTSSVRNRTNCKLTLLYSCGRKTCAATSVYPYSEKSKIPHDNEIDFVAFSRV